jgi:hypothetical protein
MQGQETKSIKLLVYPVKDIGKAVLSFFNYYTIAIACDILSPCIKRAGVSCMLHPHVNLTGTSLLSRDKLQVVSLGNAFEQRLSAA